MDAGAEPVVAGGSTWGDWAQWAQDGASWLKRRVTYEATLLWKHQTGKVWWNVITEKVILAAQPLANYDHHKLLHGELNVRAVLKIQSREELEADCVLTKHVTQAMWEELGVTYLWIQAEDFEPLSKEQFAKACEFLRQMDREGRKTVVHCKAGVGRSAAAVIAHLATNGTFASVQQALDYVKEKRPLTNMNKSQAQAIVDYVASLNNS